MAQTLNSEHRLYLVRSHQKRAMRCLSDAREFVVSKPYLSSRMSYEAVYHLAAGLFVCEGIPIPKTHRGMNSELYCNFVDKGFIPRDIAACFGQLEKDRNDDQYDPSVEIQTEEAQKDLQNAESLCTAIQGLLEKNLAELEQSSSR